MLNEFISDFRNTKYYQQILDNNKVILMYVSGSRVLGITDERSDYDIVVVVDDTIDSSSKSMLTYEGVRVHWYFRPLAEFICGYGCGLSSFGAVLFGMLTNEKVIYANPDYDAVCNLIMSNRKFIAWNGLHYVVDRYSDLVDSVTEDGVILPKNYTKILCHLCVSSCYALKHQLTEEEKGYLLQIKRIRWQPVSDEAKAWCVDRIVDLQQWYLSNPLHEFVKETELWTR